MTLKSINVTFLGYQKRNVSKRHVIGQKSQQPDWSKITFSF